MKWDLQRTYGAHPGRKYGHSMRMYDGKLYLFGGSYGLPGSGGVGGGLEGGKGCFSVFV
jgi:hypothetical protein